MQRSNSLLTVATVVATVVAVFVVSIRVHAEFFAPRHDPDVFERAAGWREYSAVGHRIGPQASRVTIVIFSDFECPYCKVAASDLKTIRKRYASDVAIIFRHFPLPNHRYAAAAAHASECADDAGRFEEFHDLLFSQVDSIGTKPWTRFAHEVGVSDVARFSRCLEDESIEQRIERDRAAAFKLGIVGTPTFLINDLIITGYPGWKVLESHVESAREAMPLQD